MLIQTVILSALAAIGCSTLTAPIYDTIIVGMGASGTAAASVLCNAGSRVLGLEAMDRVGGRVDTVPFGNSVVEVGAEWMLGQYPNPVYDLAIQNDVSILSQNLTGFAAFRSDGSNANRGVFTELVTYAMQLVAATPIEPGSTESAGHYITKKVKKYISSKYPELLDDKDFLAELLWTLDALSDTSIASYSWYDVTTDGTYRELQGDKSLSWNVHGYRTLFEILLNIYNGGSGYPNLDIQLQKEVIRISCPQDPAQDVEVRCRDGSVYKARNVIVTVSLGVLKESYQTLFSPSLPASKSSAIENLSMGLIGKIILLFPYPWWGDQRLDKEYIVLHWTEDDIAALGPEWAHFVRVTVPMGNQNAITLWTYGDTQQMVETLPDDVVKCKAMEILRRFMGSLGNIPDPIDMLRTTWYTNSFTRGTYSYENLQTPLYPYRRDDLAEPLVDCSGAPRVLFAGEATNSIHFSTVNGAVETGYREGHRLVGTSGNKC